MTNCPHCFSPLDPDLRLYRCPGPCESFTDPVASAHRGSQVVAFTTQGLKREGKGPWNPPASVSCYRCRKEAGEICPDCHLDLPRSWRAGRAVCVAMAGARATGKSVYLAVVVKQLEQMLQQMNSLLRFTTDEGRSTYTTNYEAHLYGQREIMPSTAPANVANAYQAVPMIISLGVINGVPQYLVLRDVAGEDLERPAGDQTYLSYFRRAHAVFFLFDPSAVPSVRELLRGIVPEQLMQPGDPVRVLHNLLSIIGDSSPPIAMILSKFDTLQELGVHEDRTWSTIMANPGAAFQRDPGFRETALRLRRCRAAAPGGPQPALSAGRTVVRERDGEPAPRPSLRSPVLLGVRARWRGQGRTAAPARDRPLPVPRPVALGSRPTGSDPGEEHGQLR